MVAPSGPTSTSVAHSPTLISSRNESAFRGAPVGTARSKAAGAAALRAVERKDALMARSEDLGSPGAGRLFRPSDRLLATVVPSVALASAGLGATTELTSGERRVPAGGAGRSGVEGDDVARVDFKLPAVGASPRVAPGLETEGPVGTPHPVQNVDPALLSAPQLSQNSKIGSFQYSFKEVR